MRPSLAPPPCRSTLLPWPPHPVRYQRHERQVHAVKTRALRDSAALPQRVLQGTVPGCAPLLCRYFKAAGRYLSAPVAAVTCARALQVSQLMRKRIEARLYSCVGHPRYAGPISVASSVVCERQVWCVCEVRHRCSLLLWGFCAVRAKAALAAQHLLAESALSSGLLLFYSAVWLSFADDVGVARGGRSSMGWCMLQRMSDVCSRLLFLS